MQHLGQSGQYGEAGDPPYSAPPHGGHGDSGSDYHQMTDHISMPFIQSSTISSGDTASNDPESMNEEDEDILMYNWSARTSTIKGRGSDIGALESFLRRRHHQESGRVLQTAMSYPSPWYMHNQPDHDMHYSPPSHLLDSSHLGSDKMPGIYSFYFKYRESV